MQTLRPEQISASVVSRVVEWWAGSRAKWARLESIDDLSADEIAWLAKDAGVPREDFVSLVHKPNGTAGLLVRRLAALGLDPAEIGRLSPQLLGELQRTCASCPDKQRCADDFSESANPSGWESYCSNAGTLRTLT